jgi:hypothetical protein
MLNEVVGLFALVGFVLLVAFTSMAWVLSYVLALAVFVALQKWGL